MSRENSIVSRENSKLSGEYDYREYDSRSVEYHVCLDDTTRIVIVDSRASKERLSTSQWYANLVEKGQWSSRAAIDRIRFTPRQIQDCLLELGDEEQEKLEHVLRVEGPRVVTHGWFDVLLNPFESF